MRATLLATLLALGSLTALAHAGRPLQPEDWYRFQALSDLQISPDGATLVYLVTTYDQASDESRASLWSIPWVGGPAVQLTYGQDDEAPRFSPDGRYVSFLRTRSGEETKQLWVIDRRGGEARQVSHEGGEIVAYEWSPDRLHVVLVERGDAGAKLAARRDSPSGADDLRAPAQHPQPIVIDALHFKQDRDGYLTAQSHTHLRLLAVDTGETVALTDDPRRIDSTPAFSPDGRHLAFVGNVDDDPAETARDDIYVMDARPGAAPRLLFSTATPNKQGLEWSPNGQLIAFLQGDVPRYNAYITDHLAVADAASGRIHSLGDGLDRAVFTPKFAADGRSILVSVEDDSHQYLARVDVASGKVARVGGDIVVDEIAAARGHTALLVSSDTAPTEAFAFESGKLRPLSAHNSALFAQLALGSVRDISFQSRDGTEVHGQVVEPPGYAPGRRYPAILWIHGGPNGQDAHGLALAGYSPELERQVFATHGYIVVAVNYRGSTGRGASFARAILADWGHKEVDDLLAGMDYTLAHEQADPQRLGIGGWSYGGILTDYTIASDTRFKAAISGAGSGNQTAMYGTDEYITQYNAELGPPWRDTAKWLAVSYPFFHADRIRTPTLFLGGDKDFNVPLAGGEQMYESLRTLGVPSELIIYPGEFHRLDRPSFLVDRTRRYLEWMGRYLRPEAES